MWREVDLRAFFRRQGSSRDTSFRDGRIKKKREREEKTKEEVDS